MMNYKKGKNVEEPLEAIKIPIQNLPPDFTWMQVRGGSKIRNLLPHGLKEIGPNKPVVWTGFGQSVGKAITCAEIMKREHEAPLYQITKLCYRNMEEYWDPLMPELEQLVVKRKLPMIHILLSLEPLNPETPGYQAPGYKVPYSNRNDTSDKQSNGGSAGGSATKKKQRRAPTKEFSKMSVKKTNRVGSSKSKEGES